MKIHLPRMRSLRLLGLTCAFWSATCLAATPDANVCPATKTSYPPLYDAALDTLSLDDLTKRANAGNADALMLLGLNYTPSPDHDAATALPVDMEMALALFRKAAKKRHGHAEFLIGVAYMGGAGVDKNEKEAWQWFKRAANHGSAAGQFWVGEMLAKGRAGPGDWKGAQPYFIKAAEGGAPDAFVELGYMYSSGITMPVDFEKAAFCYRQAMNKSSIASYNLRSLIDRRFVTWQQGDPGVPPKPEAP